MTMMDHDRIDLSPLHPAADAERWERMVAGIVARARVPVAAPAPARTPLLVLADWAWPTMAAAALVAGLSLVALSGRESPTVVPTGALSVAEALDLPAPVTDWLVEDRPPTESDLLVALEEMPRSFVGATEPPAETLP